MNTHRIVRYGMLNLALIGAVTLPLYYLAIGGNEGVVHNTLASNDSAQYVSNATPTGGVGGGRWVAFSSEHWGISVSEHDDLSHIYVYILDTDGKK